MKVYKRKQVEVSCSVCSKLFLKDESEVKRSEKRGMNHCCSKVCVGHNRYDIRALAIAKGRKHELYNNVYDPKIAKFYRFLKTGLSNGRETTITLEELADIWAIQEGKCIYTGIPLTIPRHDSKNDHITTASLDRIDSSKGYVSGNCQFVSISINYMKNKMTDEQTKELIALIRA